jgi:hypothetical protein
MMSSSGSATWRVLNAGRLSSLQHRPTLGGAGGEQRTAEVVACPQQRDFTDRRDGPAGDVRTIGRTRHGGQRLQQTRVGIGLNVDHLGVSQRFESAVPLM